MGLEEAHVLKLVECPIGGVLANIISKYSSNHIEWVIIDQTEGDLRAKTLDAA